MSPHSPSIFVLLLFIKATLGPRRYEYSGVSQWRCSFRTCINARWCCHLQLVSAIVSLNWNLARKNITENLPIKICLCDPVIAKYWIENRAAIVFGEASHHCRDLHDSHTSHYDLSSQNSPPRELLKVSQMSSNSFKKCRLRYTTP